MNQVISSPRPPRSSRIYLDRNPSSPELDTPSDPSVSRETKRWPLTSPSEETRLRIFSLEAWRLRKWNSERETSQPPVFFLSHTQFLTSSHSFRKLRLRYPGTHWSWYEIRSLHVNNYFFPLFINPSLLYFYIGWIILEAMQEFLNVSFSLINSGIFGMDFFIVLERPGNRVARRRRATSRLGKTLFF